MSATEAHEPQQNSLLFTAVYVNVVADQSVVCTDTIPTANGNRPDRSSLTASPQSAAPATMAGSNTTSATIEEAEMLTTLAAPVRMTQEVRGMDNGKDGFDLPADDRSSSLSELGDASDVQSEHMPRPGTAVGLTEDESEAETERLEITPRKLARTATDTSLVSEQMYQRTPSKLVHSKTIEEDDSIPPTPSFVSTNHVLIAADDGNAALHALSLASEAASLAEITGKKRKRTSAENSPLAEEIEEPARKRSSFEQDSALNISREGVVDSAEQVDVDVDVDIEATLETAEERISQLAQEEIELEERQADIAVETVTEMATVAKYTKPRKGGRRGKRKVEENIEAVASIEPQEGDGDGEGEDDSGALDEEGIFSPFQYLPPANRCIVAKKKNAIDQLAKIEKKFKMFREK
jgi:predicted nucleic acid-binding protein